jgi:hypothetical protein
MMMETLSTNMEIEFTDFSNTSCDELVFFLVLCTLNRSFPSIIILSLILLLMRTAFEREYF